MKKLWLILLLVFSPSLLFAWGVMGVSGGAPAASSGDSSCTIPTTNLTFHDEMDDNSDPHTTTSGDSVTIVGSAGVSPTIVTGKCGNATSWNNLTDDAYSGTTSGNLTRDAGTIIFWYKPADATPSTNAYLFYSGTYFTIRLDSDGSMIARWFGWSADSSTSVGLSTTEYNKIQVSWERTDAGGGEVRMRIWLYVNDVVKATQDQTEENDSDLASTFLIGQKDANDNEGAMGIIDNFTIYSVVITP